MKRLALAAALLGGTALSLATLANKPADAAVATSTFQVQAQVVNTCSISATNMSFGVYNQNTSSQATSTITVNCTLGVPAVITLDQGLNDIFGSASAPSRRMKNSATNAWLSYNLFTDSGRSSLWGNTPATGQSYTGTGQNTALNVYGLLPAGQNVLAGTYFDTVTAVITY
ncbi:Csu type fimbrial protein [Roseicella aerolata]|uniref:Spore coat U domain-containing protein n=1 Tax=Roseicella aerolata TaxID=2883479 RepID=A0A9X1LBT7_9PROT|nr:spore coat U domain-containing protein [Roseicella aerolata]MCB4823540.1 spore coat U domain-containing protein [Roseicella aerolata]